VVPHLIVMEILNNGSRAARCGTVHENMHLGAPGETEPTRASASARLHELRSSSISYHHLETSIHIFESKLRLEKCLVLIWLRHLRPPPHLKNLRWYRTNVSAHLMCSWLPELGRKTILCLRMLASPGNADLKYTRLSKMNLRQAVPAMPSLRHVGNKRARS
jgi:hypothetical protein